MSSPAEDPYDELTDSELDAILDAVQDELIAHVQQVADPTAALVAMMSDSDNAQISSQAAVVPDLNEMISERLAAVIEMRSRAAEVHSRLAEVVGRARSLAVDLDKELHNHGDLTIAVVAALAFAQHRDRHLAQLLFHARDLAIEITYDLTRVRRLDRELALDRDIEVLKELSNNALEPHALDGVRELDRAFALTRQLTFDEQITHARELSIRLDRARRLSGLRERWHNLDRTNAHQIALAIDVALVRARDLAAAVFRRLDAFEVDVASADLSRFEIADLTILTGVIWTNSTIWPPGMVRRVESLSQELTPGVYQIRPDGQRPAIQLGRHAAGRLPALSR